VKWERKSTTFLAVLAVAALFLAACGGAAETADQTDAGGATPAAGDADEVATGDAGGASDNPYLQDVWTQDGLPDYDAFDLTGEEIYWADFGGPTHVDYRNAYLDDFAATTGAEIIDASPFDYAQVRAQVESGNIQYDIITAVDWEIAADCGELYEELPDEKFYRGHITDETVQNPCVIPHGTTVFNVYYHKERYADDPPDDCADFFDLERYPGSRAMWTSTVGIPFEIALLADGVAPEDMYPIDYDRALAKYDTIRSELEFYDPLGRAQEGMMNEEWDMLIGFTAAGLRAERELGELAYEVVWPCAIAQVTSLGILKGTPRLEPSLALAGYVTTPEAQARSMSIRASSTPLKEEFFEVPEDLPEYMQKYLMLFNEDQMVMQFQDTEWWAENSNEAEQLFQQWQVQ
jgi:putative spermidine/putrescine transport system substrate-binding protein